MSTGIQNKPLIAMDIETAPGAWWGDYEDAALDANRNQITLVSIADDSTRASLRSFTELADLSREYGFVTHGGKFDFKTLIAKGVLPDSSSYAHDSMLMAVAFSHKIPQDWLDQYEAERKLKNKELKKAVHREAKGYSLKTLAPYFLGVEPFWEVEDHSDAEYGLKDAIYTWELYKFFEKALKGEGGYEFYETKLMPWSRMLLEAELTGFMLDFPLMDKKEAEAKAAMEQAEAQLKESWADVYREHYRKEHSLLVDAYNEKLQVAMQKIVPSKKKTPELAAKENESKRAKTIERYNKNMEAAISKIEPLNLASPTQLSWVLKDYFGLDITTFKGDEESTGKGVLERLAGEGREDIRVFLEYRKQQKLCTAFFPSYRDMAFNGRIYCNFNMNGARTGRLSSSNPNLQQVPGHLHEMFIAGPGRKLISYDLANIEPLLIAYFSEDPLLSEMMLQEKSFHDHNVKRVFGFNEVDKKVHKRERDACKEYGLSLLYGAWVYRMHESFVKRGFNFTLKDCKGFYKQFQEDFATFFQWKETIDAQLESGELIRNIFGRPVIVKDSVKMQGVNTLIQGSASDLLIESARRAIEEARSQGIDLRLLSVVHDEAIFDVDEDCAKEADIIVYNNLTKWKLDTPYGSIYTQAEGGINDYWRK